MKQKVFVTLVERKSLVRPKPVRQWEISITLAVSCAVPAAGLFEAKLSIMFMEKFTAKKIIWYTCVLYGNH